MIDDRLLHEHNTSEFWRSVRDLEWYAGQVCVMWREIRRHRQALRANAARAAEERLQPAR